MANKKQEQNRLHSQPYSYVYVVYDRQDKVVAMYVNSTWAYRKAETSEDYRVESYVHTGNRKAIEMEEFMTREMERNMRMEQQYYSY